MEFDEPFKSWWRVYTSKDHHPYEPYVWKLRPLDADGGNPWKYIESGPSTSGNKTLDDLIVSRGLKWIPYDKFQGVDLIKEGGFGEIYFGTWPDKNNKQVVLKSLKDIYNLDAFLREWKNHVDCLDSYEVANLFGFTKNDKGTYTAVMEYANDGALCSNLVKLSRSSWRERLYVLYKIVSGLFVIKGKNLVHCDIHDGNILINTKKDKGDKFKFGEDDEIWITDLGISKSIKSCMLDEYKVFGVEEFMAPEILSGSDSKYSTACDIYGISMIMYELTYGGRPNLDSGHLGYGNAVLNGERPKIIKYTPKCYEELMVKCWHQEPSERPDIDAVLRCIVKWIFPPRTNEEFLEIRDQVEQFIKADEEEDDDTALAVIGDIRYCFSSVYDTKTKTTKCLSQIKKEIEEECGHSLIIENITQKIESNDADNMDHI